MTQWNWGGARWWKCDLHTHTPASDDYGKGPDQSALKGRSPQDWLLDHMRAEIDCVAVTDHNSGAWIDPLKEALARLQDEQPEDVRPLHLFPGVELSVNGGTHMLAIFSPDATTSDVDSLLGAVGFPSGAKGSSNAVTNRSLPEVARAIEEAGGIAIPAHVDCDNGLFRLPGTTLAQALDCGQVFAMEMVDPSFAKPSVYVQERCGWTEILGSDSHHPTGHPGHRYPGSHFTWIKMGRPTLEGLRLALLDGPLSVRRSDEEAGDPNAHGPLVLESIEIANAHYMGQAEPFLILLNPWLNAIVGGRGTGKSTIVEFARLVLRREKELPEDLRDDFAKFSIVYPREGRAALLRDESEIRVNYRKDGARYRIQWDPSGALDPIQEGADGEWRRSEGDVSHRFPVRLFSQKQIFHMANRTRALLGVVDEAQAVARRSWMERLAELEAQYLSLRAKARELETGLLEEPRFLGELEDVTRKLAVFEEAGHADVLKAFQRRSRQQRSVEVWEEDWSGTGDRLRQLAAEIVPEALEDAAFDPASESDRELLDAAGDAREALEEVRQRQKALADRADEVFARWKAARDGTSWKRAVEAADAAYRELRDRLSEEGAGDPTAYGELVRRRHAIEQRLKDLKGRADHVNSLREQAATQLTRLQEVRRGLTEARIGFLSSVLEGNRFVRITVIPYGAREAVEEEFRDRIHKDGEAFAKDIGSPDADGLLSKLYRTPESGAPEKVDGEVEGPDPEEAWVSTVEGNLATIKQRVREIAEGRHDPGLLGDQRFANHLAGLKPEVLDRLDLWFPEDALKVEYSPTGDGRDFRPIEEGSPGQKTAALLAFLLSYGEEPLILDQPEDDLDNHLIYELIVAQLREAKLRRQILVVTHNPNIVVNGDAELVVALAARRGETRKEAEGSLQERHVRNTICKVMEGGREAFDQRYRRIALEGTRG